jgi:predicted nucleotidyltransferase
MSSRNAESTVRLSASTIHILVRLDRRQASRSCAFGWTRSSGSRPDTVSCRCAWLDRVARGQATAGSDLDVLVDMGDGSSLFRQAALQNDLEDVLGCRVHVVSTSGLRYAREHVREQIEGEAVPL